MVARPSWVIMWTWRPQPGRWRWKWCEHLGDILVIQSEASKIWGHGIKMFFQDGVFIITVGHPMSSETCFLLVNMSCETRLHSADVNEANGDGSWERIYDGLVLSFLHIERLPTKGHWYRSNRTQKVWQNIPEPHKKTSCHLRYKSTLQTHFHCHWSSCISDVWAQGFPPRKNERLEPPKTGGLEGDFPFQFGDFRWFQPLIFTDFEDFWGITTGLHFFLAMAGWIKVQLPSLCWKPRGLKTKTTVQKSCYKKGWGGHFFLNVRFLFGVSRVGRLFFLISCFDLLVAIFSTSLTYHGRFSFWVQAAEPGLRLQQLHFIFGEARFTSGFVIW